MNGFKSKTYGLILNGMIGKPASAFNWKSEGYKEFLPSVIRNVHATLDAAHKNSVYHLYIRPSNIIVPTTADKMTKDIKVLVIDWGVAISDDKKFHFQGCVPYAHDELLATVRMEKKAKSEHDWASLLYTYYHLDEGHLPWHVLMAHGKRVCDTGVRKNTVSNWLEQKRLQKSEKDEDVFQAFSQLLSTQ
ncbi:unnamed protein product [Cylindrotheca closterium]|uniref:Protein kinase domain-containing protein n=1 Tax=Cylindrotheca closterium TaxID=2856 RepID=A0AAD2FGW5_9STRA|nr:unnamed protein product [Cylindrotheca closterium]